MLLLRVNKLTNMKKTLHIATLLLLFATVANAQFTMSAEVRPRTEFRNGFKTLATEGQDPVLFTEQRSRLYLDYADTTFKLRLAFQDIRFWGETPQIHKEIAGNTFISEAWGQYYFTKAFSVKVGRQIISYDNQRFLGGLEWAQQGRRHDAALLMYEAGGSKVHLGLAYNQDDDVPEPAFFQKQYADVYSNFSDYKTFQYVWFNQKVGEGAISLLAFNAGYQNIDSTGVSYKQTLGFIGNQKIGGIKFAGDFYYQTGQFNDTKVSAYLAGVNATYGPLTVGIEHISGKDEKDASATIKSFSPDFGTNHAHNGYMDYFFVGPANKAVGVTDIYVKSSFKVAGGSLKVNVHEFLSGSTQIDGEGNTIKKDMGTEVDIVFGKKFKGGVTWNLGYSQMFATDSLEKIRDITDAKPYQSWAWSMITFQPTLFTSK